MEIILKPIGKIHSPYKKLEGMPIQPTGASGVVGTIELFKEFEGTLKDLEGFSHIYIIYLFHQSSGWKKTVKPFMDVVERGLFATRAPRRPNPIGLSLVEIKFISENMIEIANVDVLDGTPLLDIKPYIPEFEPTDSIRIGWMEGKAKKARSKRSDTRFSS